MDRWSDAPPISKEFRDIDVVSIKVAIKAASDAGIQHFVYMSVAQSAPMLKAFMEVRSASEGMIRDSGMESTFVRSWYVLGPRHWWPYLILPRYWVLERLPGTRDSAHRLGLGTIAQILNALVWSIEHPPAGIRIVDVPQMRRLGDRSLFAEDNEGSGHER